MILLDTCTLPWLASSQEQLSAPALRLVEQNAAFLFVSAITAFELGIKQRKKRLTLPLPAERYYREALATHGLVEYPDTQVAW